MEVTWNLWHGCHKKSEGCLNCYVFRRDASINKDTNIIYKTKNFTLPITKNRKGDYKYESGTMFMTCFSSDFFIEEADAYRDEALKIIKERCDCMFYLITKRPERIKECVDTKEYPNLMIACTVENNVRLKERLAIYVNIDLMCHELIFEPLLEDIDLSLLDNYKLDRISVGGESGDNARICDFNWVKSIHDYANKKGIDFFYHQTGARLLVNGKEYQIPRYNQHSQAQKAFKD